MISPKEFALQHKTGLCEYYLEIYNHTYYSLKFSKVVHRIQGIIHGGGDALELFLPSKSFPSPEKIIPPTEHCSPPPSCIHIYFTHMYLYLFVPWISTKKNSLYTFCSPFSSTTYGHSCTYLQHNTIHSLVFGLS